MFVFFFFKQKTAYEMRISDWSSDVCSSDLPRDRLEILVQFVRIIRFIGVPRRSAAVEVAVTADPEGHHPDGDALPLRLLASLTEAVVVACDGIAVVGGADTRQRAFQPLMRQIGPRRGHCAVGHAQAVNRTRRV